MEGYSIRVALFFGALCCASHALAETVVPEKVEYGVEAKLSNPSAGSCLIGASLSSTAPEVVNFRAGAWSGSNNGSRQMYLGFTLDVGNWIYKDGLPIALKRTPVSETFFASKTFNSRGRFYDVDFGDGGHGQITGDASVGSLFLFAVYVGNFDITFSAPGIDERTYHVNEAPAPPVLADYHRCLDALLKSGQ